MEKKEEVPQEGEFKMKKKPGRPRKLTSKKEPVKLDLNKAKEEAIANLSAAKDQIKIERDKAIVEIKGEVVNLSLSIAEKLVNKNLSKEDNKSLIDESLKNVKGYEA